MTTRLKDLRQEHGISQDRLARYCDVTRETIRTVERGDTKPNVYLALRIARVTVEYLWGGELDATPNAPAVDAGSSCSAKA